MAESDQEVPLQHNFRRGGSRVYYASENGCWPANSLSKDLWTHPGGTREPVILEVGEEVSSSGEEALEGEASPRGSFRGSLRGSSSHRSQDSGYSDSGESTNTHNDSDSLPTTPPNVKHITRVYFGENTHLYNDKIVCVPKKSTTATNVSTTTSTSFVDAKPLDVDPCKNQLKPPQRHDRTANLEELAEELEHKSVLEAAIRRTGAIRKRISNAAAMMVPRKPQRRGSSVEKLLTDAQLEQHRRLTALRTRRRWSVGDVHPPHTKIRNPQQNAGPSHVSCGTNTHITCGNSLSTSRGNRGRNPSVDLRNRAIDSWSLEYLDDPLEASRLAGDIDPETTSVLPSASLRRPKTQPMTVAQELR